MTENEFLLSDRRTETMRDYLGQDLRRIQTDWISFRELSVLEKSTKNKIVLLYTNLKLDV